MATATKKRPSATRSSAKAARATAAEESTPAPAAEPGVGTVASADDAYELPIIHAKVPAGLVEVTFWSALGGAALVGMLSPPAAMMIGAGVLVARHQMHRS
ncbi:MAG: hypothetical protein R2726_15630 [Acidimicrobiales bacterium]